MKPAIILMAAILSLQSCCHKIYPSTSQTTSTIETITEIIRDTVIQTQPDTAILQALIRCDSTGRASLEEIITLKQSVRTQQTITIAKDPQPHKPTPITITTTVDSMGIYLTYKERYKQTTQTQVTETIIEKEVNILNILNSNVKIHKPPTHINPFCHHLRMFTSFSMMVSVIWVWVVCL